LLHDEPHPDPYAVGSLEGEPVVRWVARVPGWSEARHREVAAALVRSPGGVDWDEAIAPADGSLQSDLLELVGGEPLALRGPPLLVEALARCFSDLSADEDVHGVEVTLTRVPRGEKEAQPLSRGARYELPKLGSPGQLAHWGGAVRSGETLELSSGAQGLELSE